MQRFTRTAALTGLAILGAGCESPGEAVQGEAADPGNGPAAETDAPAAAAEAIPAGPWRLTGLRRPDGTLASVPADGAYTLEFSADGRYSGVAHCNRYGGGYEQTGPGSLALSAGMSTRMACPEPSLEYEFLAALGESTGYEVDGDTLRIRYGDGGVLSFTRDDLAPQAAAAPPGQTFVYECEGVASFTVRTGPGEVALWAPAELGGRYIILAATPAASGARYASEDVVYWSRGAVASFEIGGQRFVDCPSNPAKVPWADAARRGAVFRALGNEPAWNVEVYADRFVVVTDLGARRKETPYSAAESSGLSTTYRGAAATPNVRVDRVPCTDTMSGDVFEATATATLEDRILHGCGRFL